MEIPVQKKLTHYLVSTIIFLVGVVAGGIIVSYVFFKVKDRMCIVSQPPVVSTALTATQIQQAASLEQNRTIFGTIVATEVNSFSLQFPVTNPLDVKNSTTTTVKVPFDTQKDEVIKLSSAPATPNQSSVKEVKASFGDIEVGQQVLLKILNGKKTVFIPTS